MDWPPTRCSRIGPVGNSPLVLVVVHTAIDRIKLLFAHTPLTFAVDQLAHVLSLAALAWIAKEANWISEGGYTVWGRDAIIGVAGFCATVLGAGFFIGAVAEKMMQDNPALREDLSGNGLRGGGAQIGRLERALIFLLLVMGQPNGIGFLIAAKFILRFEEARKQHLAEYILIGTLWSFGLAIGLGWLTLYLL